MITTFEKAKVGDRVFSSVYGWGTIDDTNCNNNYPIHVNFGSHYHDTYTFEGYNDKKLPYRTLFWDEIKFEIPEMPKRMVKVKKVNEYWKLANKKGVTSVSSYKSEAVAIEDREYQKLTEFIYPMKVTQEWIVIEEEKEPEQNFPSHHTSECNDLHGFICDGCVNEQTAWEDEPCNECKENNRCFYE